MSVDHTTARIGARIALAASLATREAEPEPRPEEKSEFVAKILSYPDERLREVSRPVAIEDDRAMEWIRKLVIAMREAMYDRGGIGLAAVQIGVPVGVFIVHVKGETNEPLVFVNPEILSVSPDKCEITEGCLSLGLERDLIERPRTCVVRRHDHYGRRDVHEYRGMTARVIQHEYDHLSGKMFIDYLAPARQRMMERSMQRRSKKKALRELQAVETHSKGLEVA